MKLVVFLGNPGSKYAHNRHNVGWLFGDYFSKKYELEAFREDKKVFGATTTFTTRDEKVLLLKPLTFMNRSGTALLAAKQFFKLELSDILMVFDDKDLPFGEVRFRAGGGSGGHNGVNDILRVCGSEAIARIKIGVDDPMRTEFSQDTAAFVLSDFSAEQQSHLPDKVFPSVEEKLLTWLAPDVDKTDRH